MPAYFARGLLIMLAALLFGCIVSPQASSADKPGSGLATALDAGKPFVLVVSPAKPDAATLESEAYGDWASGLAAFQTRAPDGITVVTASAEDYAREIAKPAVEDGFATLFVNGGGRALIHQGLLLDPFLYDCGANFLRKLPSCPEAPAYGMPEMGVTRR
jgi:hypothetical protein